MQAAIEVSILLVLSLGPLLPIRITNEKILPSFLTLMCKNLDKDVAVKFLNEEKSIGVKRRKVEELGVEPSTSCRNI